MKDNRVNILKEHRFMSEFTNNKNAKHLNVVFHMIDLFDKHKRVTGLKLKKDSEMGGCFGRMITQVYSSYDRRNKRWNYRHIEYEIRLNMDWLDIFEDAEYDKNSILPIEIIALHELCHMYYHEHSKRFFKKLRNMMYTWLAYRDGSSVKEAKVQWQCVESIIREQRVLMEGI